MRKYYAEEHRFLLVYEGGSDAIFIVFFILVLY